MVCLLFYTGAIAQFMYTGSYAEFVCYRHSCCASHLPMNGLSVCWHGVCFLLIVSTNVRVALSFKK